MTTEEGVTAPEFARPPHTLSPLTPGRAAGQGARLLVPPLARRIRLAAQRLIETPGHPGRPVVVYTGSRLLLVTVAGLVSLAGHREFASGFFLFDGQWYLRLAEHGYPDLPLRTQSTLGFLPLYPLAVRAVAWALALPLRLAALVTSFLGGLAAAILVQRLATSWWGERAGDQATLVFSLFPGSIVFSMAYSECLTVPLGVGCLLALRSRRWAVAGLLAGLATAVEPMALVLVAVCLAAAGREVRSHGWRDPAARRSMVAPLLAPLGIGGFALFLWAWTGTPFASYFAQHYGWHQQDQPLALLALPLAQHLLGHPHELITQLFSWNILNGLLGGVFLFCSIVVLVRGRRELTPGALVATAGVAAVTLWSVLTPPNARMVLVAFPAVMVWGRRLSGWRLGVYVTAEVILLLLASALTFSGHMLP